MPNTINFNGQQVVEPGVKAQILGQVPSPAQTVPYSNVFLIDTGSNGQAIGQVQPAFGGGSGIIGQLQSNGNSIYSFTNAPDFQNFVRGGVLWDLANYLFTPSFNGQGTAKVYHARAATTTAPQFTFALPGPSSTSAGSLVLNCINEGLANNGVLTGGIVTRGYGVLIKAGIINPSAFIIQFYQGQFKGLGADGNPYDGIQEANQTAYIVSTSIEFTTAAQFIAWATTDQTFSTYFQLDPSTVTSTVVIQAAVLTTYSGIQLFAGGTTVYSLTALQAILDNITDYDNSCFLCDDYGVTPSPSGTDISHGCNKGGLSAFNQAILTHIITQANYPGKMMYIGGGQDSTQYTTMNSDGSQDQAIFYNSALVTVVHSAVKVPSTLSATGIAYKYVSSLYGAALGCGRIEGLTPQTPGTYKDIRIIGLKHEFKKSERVNALQHGVFHYRKVPNLGWVINQSINTLQINASIIYNNGTSPEISIMRIIWQLNSMLILNGVQFVGGNLNTVSPVDIQTFTNSLLLSVTAEPLADNLILPGPHSVTVAYSNGVYNIKYCFVPNAPINQLFWTGYMLDPSVSITNQGQ